MCLRYIERMIYMIRRTMAPRTAVKGSEWQGLGIPIFSSGFEQGGFPTTFHQFLIGTVTNTDIQLNCHILILLVVVSEE
jgi:hypothetical protein